MQKLEWIKCPICGNKTRLKMRSDTIMKNFPLYCPKFLKKSLIDVNVKNIDKSQTHRRRADKL